MSAPVHIIGAGVVGSVLMRRLSRHKVDFTWSDIDSPIVAWKASTGSVCPEKKDPVGLIDTWRAFANECLEPGEFEEVPHLEFKNGAWFQGHETSLHLDVQSFVTRTRELFSERRIDGPTEDSLLKIQTAGSVNAQAFWWGWSVQIRSEMLRRCSFSARVVRQVRYLYPKPGAEFTFYLGSSITYQRKPKELDIQKHLAWFEKDWASIAPFGGAKADYTQVTEPVCGWRPVGEPGKWKYDDAGTVTISPMSASGVKYSPLVAQQIIECFWPTMI